MPKVTIDGAQVEVPLGATVIQACERAGVEVPRFCYHRKLSIAGNCRMCLVEIEKAPKLVSSCSYPASDGMVVHTKGPRVDKARKGVMEFLLINHPLDCPICDQGGECDLQDQAMAYGMDCSRFEYPKRAVQDKDMGPLIRTNMTRCIHCTRCVRFMREVAGTPELGMISRGKDAEIVSHIRGAFSSELSANIADLCPVGALTAGPNAFEVRSWEYKSTDTVDVMDAVGSHITVQSRHGRVFRILPRACDEINEDWISDKTRFACDGLGQQRLDVPYVRDGKTLREVTWDEAIEHVVGKIRSSDPRKVACIAGDLACIESMQAAKALMRHIGSPNYDCRQDGSLISKHVHGRSSYIFNSTFRGVEKADALLLVGCDPRKEAAVFNARLYQRWLRGNFDILSVGWRADWLYEVDDLGHDPTILSTLDHPSLRRAKFPMVIVGASALAREDSEAILSACLRLWRAVGGIRTDWNGFNVLQQSASRVGGLDLGFVPEDGGLSTEQILRAPMDVLYLLGADEVDLGRVRESAFVIYQGTHGDVGAQIADVILPAAAYTEKRGTWTNAEGKQQISHPAVAPPGLALQDALIIAKISEGLGGSSLVKGCPLSSTEGPVMWDGQTEQRISNRPLSSLIKDFYLTNPILRASCAMAECSRLARQRSEKPKVGEAA